MPDLTPSFIFVLEIDSVEMGSFRKCSGIESETETIEYKEATKDGRMIIRKVPGAMKWSDITLERRIDETTSLWEWRKQARRDRLQELQAGGGRPLGVHLRVAVEVDGRRLRRRLQRDRHGKDRHHPRRTGTGMSLNTEYPFTLPKGYVDDEGTLHRTG